MLPTPTRLILIVDDNPVDRLAYRRLLSRQRDIQYEFVEADLGVEGLSLYREQRPDCVLLDYNLPDISGLDFLKALQTQSIPAPLPIVMLTGEGNEAIAVDAMKQGAQDYLLKGKTSRETLERAIHNTIEKIHLYKSLQQREEEFKQFAHTAAHDLKSPLTRISNYVQLLERRYREVLDQRAQRYIEEILSGTQHMTEVIEALLAFAQAGRSKAPFTAVALEEVLRLALAQLEPQIEATQAKVTLGVMPTVLGNEIELVRLFQNLLSNALKFHKPQPDQPVPCVHIYAEEEHNIAKIAVRDNGIGIPSEQHAEIFKPFYRAHPQDAYRGTGIGLAACQNIVKQHLGKLWFESAEGKGSTFWVSLPLVKKEESVTKE